MMMNKEDDTGEQQRSGQDQEMVMIQDCSGDGGGDLELNIRIKTMDSNEYKMQIQQKGSVTELKRLIEKVSGGEEEVLMKGFRD